MTLFFLGYGLAYLMGLTLGLIGAGGAMLTVPILVYLMGIKPVIATGYSLLIVGTTTAIGAFYYWRECRVDLKAALLFAVPAMTSVYFARRILLPVIPEQFSVWTVVLSKNSSLMVLFGIIMLAASAFMLKPSSSNDTPPPALTLIRSFILICGSALVGLVSGLVGAGGGFLIIPILIGVLGLSMKIAVGTSLTIITINSQVGFQGDLAAGIPLDWSLLISFLVITLMGLASGIGIGKHVDGQKLKKIFGYFTLVLGLIILVTELGSLRH